MEWREISGYPNYFVSETGLVRHGDKFLKPSIKQNGYEYLNLANHTKYYVHRLVASAFIPNLELYRCVNHKDGKKRNNNVSNLEWCSHAHNNRHAFLMGLKKPTIRNGILNALAKFTDAEVLSIRNGYSSKTTFAEIGRKYNVHYSTIADIINRKTWRHI